MKYWVFQNNQVTGPFEPEDLPQTPGYTGETLICPEGRKGTSMGDWQRASNVPELSMSVLKASQLALAVRGGGYPALPPEPTLKDLAALGSLQEKVSLLDSTVSHLQESLRLKDEELLSLHKELEEKSRHAEDLALKLGGLEERFTAVKTLREGLDKAVAAEHDVEATVSQQSQMITELKAQLEALSAEQKKAESLKAEIAQLRQEQEAERGELQRQQTNFEAKFEEAKAAAAAVGEKDHEELERTRAELERKLAEAAAKPAPMSFEKPTPLAIERTPTMPEPLPSERPSPSVPSMMPSTAPQIPASQMPTPLLSPVESASPFGAPLTELTPLGSPAGSNPNPFEPMGMPNASSAPPLAAPMPTPAPVVPPPVTGGDTAGKPKAKGRSGATLVIGALVIGGGLAAWKLGAPVRRSVPAQAKAPVLPAAAPPMPSPEAELEAQKKRAIDLVRAAAPSIEASNPAPAGGLSPWFADKIRDGVFQVNFYPPKTAGGSAGQTYEFEAALADGVVSPHNDAAAALLSGKPLKQSAAKDGGRRRGKVPIKAKAGVDDGGGSLLDNPLNLDESSSGEAPAAPAAAPAPKSGKAKKTKARKPQAPPKDESLDELLEPGAAKEAAAEPAGPSAAQPARKGSKKAQPADAELLDDLLKP